MRINYLKKYGAAIFILFSFLIVTKTDAAVFNNLPDELDYVPNDTVWSITKDDSGNIYIGGAFTEMAYKNDNVTGYAVINKDSGSTVSTALELNGSISISTPDGVGGFYAFGYFTYISGEYHNRIVHIRADGSIDPNFLASITGGPHPTLLRDMVLYDGKLYLFGNLFSNGHNNNYFFRIDATTGAFDDSFTPTFNNLVTSLVFLNENIYVVGAFTLADSSGVTTAVTTHNRLVKMDMGGVIDHTFNPSINGVVNNISTVGSDFYIGGAFTTATSVGTTTALTRNRLAKMSSAGIVDASFNPNFNGTVNGAVVSGSDLYVRGAFTTVISAGTSTVLTRGGLARLNTSGQVDASFSPSFNDTVQTIYLNGADIYAGGDFTTVSPTGTTTAVTQKRLVKLDNSGLVDSSFAPIINSSVSALFINGNNLHIGGNFTSLNSGIARGGLAKFNPDGTLDQSFNPIFNNTVYSIAASGTDLYVGGVFTTAASAGTTMALTRNYLVKMNSNGVIDNAFNPGFGNYVNDILLSGQYLYVGGTFTTATSAGTTTALTRNRLAKLNLSGIVDLTFNPNFSSTVRSLAEYNSYIYVGGGFTTVASAGTTTAVAHSRVARLSSSGIIDHAFNPILNDWAYSFAFVDSDIYIAGTFSAVSSAGTTTSLARSGVLKMNSNGVIDPDFNFVGTGLAYTMQLYDSELYLGGTYTLAMPNGGASYVERARIVKLGLNGNLDLNFNPKSGARYINDMIVSDGKIYYVGFGAPFLTRFSPDTLAPALTLSGRESISLNRGTNYTDAGATALDANFGDLSSSISTNNPVDINRPGTYLITYTITDVAGNTSTATRTVTVNANESLPSVAISYTPFFLNPSAPLATSTSATSTLSITIEPIISSTSGTSTTPVITSSTSSAPISSGSISASLSSRLSGRILLQVESHGEAWYVNPDNNKRYYLGRPDDAFTLMRELGLGATTKDINSFINSSAPSRLSGKILLQVQDKGQAFYVSPTDLKLYYLGRPADAFALMRAKGLGITNGDLEKIEIKR